MKMPDAIIHGEIEKHGAIPFSRFMELALYCPEYGYYETKKDIGKCGDFYTSVSVGNLFGKMLAFQFAEWLEQIKTLNPQPSTLNLLEAGAHNGQLAKDILEWLQSHQPKLFSEIKYIILEPSSQRQNWQKEILKKFAGKVFWISQLSNLNNRQFHGIIFGNELLDAFPIQRFGWSAKEKAWFEWGVAIDGDKFIWKRTQNSKLKIQNLKLNLSPELLEVLPDNYTIEHSPSAENWWRDAANILRCGKLLTIDYGYTADEQFSPARLNGTLRAYFNHHITDDVLANAGEQDLTAHVNFSAIQKVGEQAGLKTELFTTQTKFLTQILQKLVASKLFDNSQARQFQTLTHPDHLGRAFHVLVQSR